MNLTNDDIMQMHWQVESENSIVMAVNSWSGHRFICIMDDNSIQYFNGYIDENCEGEVNQYIYCSNEDYDDIDRIVLWIEVPDVKPKTKQLATCMGFGV